MKISHVIVGTYLLSQAVAQTEKCKVSEHSLRAATFVSITSIVLFTMCIIMLTVDLACHFKKWQDKRYRLSPSPEGAEAPPPYIDVIAASPPPPPYEEPIMMEEL